MADEGLNVDYLLIRRTTPTVIFAHGLGTTFQKSWGLVYPEIALRYTVLAYNRAGYGRTRALAPALSLARDADHVVAELRALLLRLDLPPPYVLVGHSMGGLYLQLFARRHPDEVAGLLLVDSTHPGQFEGVGDIALRPWWFRAGFHLFLRCYGGLAEWACARSSGQQVMAAPALSGVPVVALVSGRSGSNTEICDISRHDRDMKQDFARLYPGCELQWLDCGHDIPREKPAVVIEAINRICRSDTIRR